MGAVTLPGLRRVTSYRPGEFCWSELLAVDVDAARSFYGALFGWSFDASPIGEEAAGEQEIYTVCQIEGEPIAGIAALRPEHLEAGATSSWGAHVTVADVDAATAAALAAGATLFMPPMDAGEMGRTSCFQDPTGGVITLWQPRGSIGASFESGPGVPMWRELYTHDTAAAAAFYAQVLGWTMRQVDFEGEAAFVCSTAEDGVAMILPILPRFGEMPVNWAIYFQVADVPATLARIQELGGRTLAGPGVWRMVDSPFAVAEDSQGGVFSIVAPRA